MKKKAASDKCPACKGTGEHRVSRYKCTECNGTGKAQHFEMIFWGYDQFPYVLASRGFMQDNGFAYVPTYNGCFRPMMTLPLKEGEELKAWLEELDQEHKRTLKSVGEGFRARLAAVVPKAIKNKG